MEELREMCKADFGIVSKDLAGKVKVSRLICAWSSAKARAVEQARTEAAAQVRNLAKPVPTKAYNGMRKLFKEQWWKLDDSKAPSQS